MITKLLHFYYRNQQIEKTSGTADFQIFHAKAQRFRKDRKGGLVFLGVLCVSLASLRAYQKQTCNHNMSQLITAESLV